MSTALDVTLKVLYVQGPDSARDIATIDQLRRVAAELQITTIAGPAAALAELRRTPGWQGLLVSPSLPQNETLALITSLRRDRIPIAIVPVVDESHQDLFASAVASGADDVLVRRGESLVNVSETLTRMRQSPHLFPAEQRRRISVLYAGRDPLVWNLLDQVPFAKAERVSVGVDGACPVRKAGTADNSLRADAVIVDEQPGEAHPLQVLKSVKAQASDLPVIVLTSAGSADIATAALELGADDTVLKTGIFRRRLIATLRRVHQRLELTAQQVETKAREERLRQIVENVPTGIIVIGANAQVLAMNGAALQLFGATKPRDIVGRDFRQMVGAQDHGAITELIRTVTRGEPAAAPFEALTLDGGKVAAHLQAVVLERDARGGRGVVASVTPASQTQPTTEGQQELTELQESLQRMEQHFAELEQARANERSAWESERRRLETRLEEAERLASERASLEDRLDEVTAELARTSRSFAEEREALELRLRELEAAAREASAIGATKDELERALTSVRDEQQQAIAAHALERSGWEAIRTELESRVRDLGLSHETETASLVSTLQAEMRELQATFAGERERWNATREQLETELRNAREALWTEHSERDGDRAAAEAELTRAREAHEAAAADWSNAQAALEQEVSAARTAADAAAAERDRARADSEAGLAGAREAHAHELAQARAASGAERDQLVESRERVEQELASLRSEFETERLTWQQRRNELEDDLRRAQNAEGAQRELLTVRGRLEAELDEARQQIALERGAAEALAARSQEEVERAQEAARAVAEEYDATRARLEQERDETRQAADDARETWQRERAALQEELADVRGRLQHVEQQLHDERTAAARANESLAATRSEWEGLRAALESDLAASREREDATAQARYALEEALSRARDDAQQARDETAARLREELAALQTEADAAAAGRDEAQDRVSTLTSALELARHDLDALRLEREGIGSAAEELRAARDEAYRQLDAAHAERDEARRVAEAVGRDRDNLRSDLDNLRQQFESLDSELRDLRALHAGERDGLSADLERLQRELESVRTDRDDLQQKFGTLSSALEAERQRAKDRDHLAAALDAARNEIRHTDAAHHAEREGWERTRGGLEQQVRQARADHDNDRSAWTRLREESEALAREASGLRDGLRRAEAALETARADYAALAATLADERTRSASTRDEIDNVRRALADAEARGTDREATLTRAVRAAEAGLAQQTSAYESRLIELEAELRKADERLAEAASRAEATRTELRAGYTRAWESHARLVATDIFGYAVTTQSGDLLRCNDAFARMFGHVNAAELLARTAGRPFQPLANRQDVLARLNSTGRIDHLESCVERADGHAMRLTESLVLAGSDDHPDSRVIEHVVIATPAGPSAEELQRRRLQEVGALAAAMTPELETLATKVAARGDELRRDLTAGRLPGAQAFDDLHSSVLRLGSLVRQLSGFSRRQAREAETVELGTALTRAEGMLSRLAGDFVSFSTRQVPTPPVHVQASDLEQLLTSLVTTGRDLLPRGGALSVEVAQNEGGTAPDAGPFNMPGAALSVHASGYGVKWPDSTASLEDIARRCGGHLRVQGEAGRDVRLDVIFPRCGN